MITLESTGRAVRMAAMLALLVPLRAEAQEETGAVAGAVEALGAGQQEPSPPVAPAVVAPAGQAEAAELDPAEDLFVRKCASCHTVGKGQRVGPDLQGAHERRERAWLLSMIESPSSMLGTDPVARQLLQQFQGVRMPDLGLTAAQVGELVDLIARCSSEPCDLVGRFAPVATATADDVARGRAIYLGELPLSAEGAPCISCHTVRGAGTSIPGGLLSKDLTHAFGRLGDEGLDAALKNPAFPVMNRVFQDHPLTPEEVFALRAFLHEANRTEPPAEATWNPLLVALLGTLAVLAILNAAWSRRLQGVRRALTGVRAGEELP